MATTPTLTFCDELVTLLTASWSPSAPDAVARAYQFRQDAASLTGRRVYVMPTDYGFEPADRGEDRVEHRVTTVVLERYTDPGLPDNAWLDARVDFVYSTVVKGLYFAHGGPLKFGGRSVFTESVDVQVLDLEKLTTTPAIFFAVIGSVHLEILAA